MPNEKTRSEGPRGSEGRDVISQGAKKSKKRVGFRATGGPMEPVSESPNPVREKKAKAHGYVAVDKRKGETRKNFIEKKECGAPIGRRRKKLHRSSDPRPSHT